MKKLIAITIGIAIILTSGTLLARRSGKLSARYQPVADFVDAGSTLAQWYKQYVDTTSGSTNFSTFLKRLSGSDVLYQRSRRARLSYNQLYLPISNLSQYDWKDIDNMSQQDVASIRLSMLELDIVLAAIESTLPETSYEEFRREIIRGAKPLTEVAKLPVTAVEAMAFTLQAPRKESLIPSINPQNQTPPEPNRPELASPYRPW